MKFSEILDQVIPPLGHFDLNYKLLDSLCNDTEAGILKSIEEFKKNGLLFEEIDYDPEYGSIGFEHYKNITHLDVLDLEKTIILEFPSMQRRSVFLTIFGIFEHEIERFCDDYSRKHRLNVRVTDFKGSGIERSHLFIKKITGVEISMSSLKKLQKLRNTCAHQDAKYKLPDGQEIDEIVKLVKSLPSRLALNDDKVLVKEGFLNWVLLQFASFFREIEEKLRNSALE